MTGMLIAIDPGPTESAYVIVNPRTFEPWHFAKLPNRDLLERIRYGYDVDLAAIEEVRSYGQTVGIEVFSTCRWTGRFEEALQFCRGLDALLVPRHEVKLHHCHATAGVKDSNVTQALVDRFTPGAKNFGKGTKTQPGFFHGFTGDVWQAYALAVYVADTVSQPASNISPGDAMRA